jgi:hypothetical protein
VGADQIAVDHAYLGVRRLGILLVEVESLGNSGEGAGHEDEQDQDSSKAEIHL